MAQRWIDGGDFVYMKTDCRCLEHIEVAEIIQALEMFKLGWWASKDRQNNVTIMVPKEYKEQMEALGCVIQPRETLAKDNTYLSR